MLVRPDDIASGAQLAVGSLPHRLPVRRLLSFVEGKLAIELRP